MFKYIIEDGVFYLGILVIKILKMVVVCNEFWYFLVSFLLDGMEMEVEVVDLVINEMMGVKFDFIGWISMNEKIVF